MELEVNSDTQIKMCNVATRAQMAKATLGELPFYNSELKASTNKQSTMKSICKKHQTFHINLLKEFEDPPETVSQHFFIQPVEEEEVEEQFFPTDLTETGPFDVTHLTSVQQEEINALLDPELFTEQPGFTNLVHHNIYLKETAPS
ncbi:GLC7-interacting protein 4 [Dissostichus eleginoides]|uniref:GLC7-interacting protein 4 n=1 Tax=Dissostichus eleginoides TaxID=100907 RepID=A0AAD9FMX3_DISEL|nr:GLC7-interacting protein 4 [Dissostichus eleginoides]